MCDFNRVHAAKPRRKVNGIVMKKANGKTGRREREGVVPVVRKAHGIRMVNGFAAFVCTALSLGGLALLLSIVRLTDERAGEQGTATVCYFAEQEETARELSPVAETQALPDAPATIQPPEPVVPDPVVDIDVPPVEPVPTVEALELSLPESELAVVEESLFETPHRAAPRERREQTARFSAPASQQSAAEGDYTPPTYRSAPLPPYPAAMRQSRVEGTAQLRIFIDERGTPSKVEVASSSGHGELDAAARRWVLEHWLFTPARRGNVAVATSVLVRVRFVID